MKEYTTHTYTLSRLRRQYKGEDLYLNQMAEDGWVLIQVIQDVGSGRIGAPITNTYYWVRNKEDRMED